MIGSIVRSSMRFQFLVITIAIALMAFGITQLGKMPVDNLPEFSPPYVEIQTEALGLSAKEVEQMITVPLEQDLLAGVAWLDVIRSQSVPGLSSILIHFEPGTDLYQARQMVAERIALSPGMLPRVSKPPTMIQPLSSASRFMIVGLSSKNLSPIETSVLAQWTIAPRLMGVPGVAHVAIWGNRERQLQVLVDPEELQANKVSLDQIIRTTGNALWVSPLTFLKASSPGSGGFIDTPNQRLTIWHVLPISSPAELANVPIEGTQGILLGNVAQVVEDHQPLIGGAVANDSSNILLVIEKLPGTNTLKVTRDVENALAALKPGLPGIEFDATLFRPASYLEMAASNLLSVFVISALLIVLVLSVFLYGWRTALISLAGITTSLFAALFVLYLQGATLNSMVLAGLVIALGLIIDDIVVDVENVLRRLRENHQAGSIKSPENVIQVATIEMRSSVFFAALVTLLAVVPIFVMDGIPGALLQPAAIAYALSIVVAMVVALTITPALCLLLLSSRRLEYRASPLASILQNSYGHTLERNIGSPVFAILSVVILGVVGLSLVPFIQQKELLPTFQEPYITVKLENASGTSYPEMNRIVTQMISELRAIPGVSNVGAHVGRAVFGDQVVGINSSSLWIKMDPRADFTTVTAAVNDVVSDYTGLNPRVLNYTQQILDQPQRVNPNDDITLRIYGKDIKPLQAEAEKLIQSLEGINGVAEAHMILPPEEPALEIEVDLALAQKYGIKPGDVRRIAATLLSGIHVGSLFEEQKVFDVVVWGVPKLRNSISDISNLMLQLPDGGFVRLGDVASVRIRPSQTVIQHDAMSPYLDVGFTVEGRAINAVAQDIEARTNSYTFPLEYHAEVLSNTTAASQQRTIVAMLIVLIGIFLLLQASARSWRMAFVTFLTLPAALAGGVIAAFIINDSLSLASLLGLLAVFGITARNNILLITRLQQMEEDKGEIFGSELVLRGSKERVAPIVITSLTTGLALLPFAFSGNIPGLEIVAPMAIIIVGGLVSSTLINLFALPALYLRFGANREAELGLKAVPEVGLSPNAAD